MLKNGNFKERSYVFPNASWGVLIPPKIKDDHSPLPRWIIESFKAVKYIDVKHFSVPKGRRAVELVAGKESALAQVVKTEVNKTYALSFAVGNASNACAGMLGVEAYDGRDNNKVTYASEGKGGFKKAY